MSADQLKGGDNNLKVPASLMDAASPDPCVCMLPDAGGRRGPPRRAWSCIEKGLVVGLSLALLVIFILLLIIFLKEPILPKRKAPCGDSACVRVAGEVLSKADLSVDPCDDFYQYACGGWLADIVLPPDRSRFGVATKPVEQNQLRLKAVLEGADNLLYGKPSSAVQKAKDFYNACVMYEDLRGGAHNISKIIGQLGSWTVTRHGGGQWEPSSWSVERALHTANQYQVWPLFDRDVRQDLYDSRHMVITFSPPDLSAPGTIYYLGPPAEKFRAAFRALFAQVSLVLGADNRTAHEEADRVWLFERRLAQILKDREHENRQELYRKVTLRELQNATGKWINLSAYLALVHEQTVPDTEDVVVMDIHYMRQLRHIVNSTPRSTLANYVVWRVVKSLIPHAGADFRSARLRFKQTMEGVSDLGATWDACIGTTTQVLGQATGAMFAERYLSQDGKDKAGELLKLLKAAFLQNLPSVDWMVESTRHKAAAKLAAMVDMVGYGSVSASAQALDTYYERMSIANNNAFGNWIEAVNFHFRRTRDMRGRPRDRKDWGYTSPTAVNAFYQQQDNAMMFPAGILRPPFFDNSYPMAMNLGAIGTVMAHELTHGFDDQGRRYNKWGSLRDWWDNASRDAFMERAQCFVDQYSQYTVAGLKVDGRLTLSENLADNGAVRTAYKAYSHWLGQRGGGEQGARLPGANTTESQTFFLAYAQLFCTYYTPEFATRLLYTDTHTSAKYRVIGALSNFERFSEAFSCKPNTLMNPPKKCRLW